MYQPRVFTLDIQKQLRDTQTATVIEVTDAIELLTNRSIELIVKLGGIAEAHHLSGSILLMTLIRELDTMMDELLAQNDLDVQFIVKLFNQNAAYPSKTLLSNQKEFGIDVALAQLSKDVSNPDHLGQLSADGTASESATIELRKQFAFASRKIELVPDNKPHVVTEADVDMSIWLGLLAIAYLVVLDIEMPEFNCKPN
ncbi:hypothetical protein OH460_08905 [Vibrio sp. Makdt]|uniref:hypothetical protein n=1 Tax=Vibrio sp. Makdt TaxID=2998828 RepID=UPI0022CDB9A4|nr:hypothetical protein [Vibrio sp. Makdt]MDA0152420.1 hypothetical protein [Vibrio sp. Makdt]